MVKKFIFLISFIIVIVGGFTSYYVFLNSGESQKNQLLSRAETIAALISSNDLIEIFSLKEKFKGIINSNNDIRFAYALAENNKEIFFIADSEDPTSPDYSPYGQIYYEASDVLKDSFKNKTSSYEIATDRWGTWFSALAPIIENDEVKAIIGLDIDAKSYYQNIILYTTIPVSITLIILIVLWSAYSIYRKEQETAKIKSNFITQASHDLRSPLSGIRWGTESLLKTKDLYTKEQQDTLNMIYVSTIKIAAILKDLMQISVIDSRIKKQVLKNNCDVFEVVKESIKDLNLFTKEKNINIINELKENAIVAFADIHDLKQVFSNLISNSIKYSKPGSTVTINSITYGKNSVIFIVDQGIGIPKEEQKKVLQGFYRSTNARKLTDDGTGLGLYSAKKVVELYGGSLTFKSEENKGSTFIVTLPKTNAK